MKRVLPLLCICTTVLYAPYELPQYQGYRRIEEAKPDTIELDDTLTDKEWEVGVQLSLLVESIPETKRKQVFTQLYCRSFGFTSWRDGRTALCIRGGDIYDFFTQNEGNEKKEQ